MKIIGKQQRSSVVWLFVCQSPAFACSPLSAFVVAPSSTSSSFLVTSSVLRSPTTCAEQYLGKEKLTDGKPRLRPVGLPRTTTRMSPWGSMWPQGETVTKVDDGRTVMRGDSDTRPKSNQRQSHDYHPQRQYRHRNNESWSSGVTGSTDEALLLSRAVIVSIVVATVAWELSPSEAVATAGATVDIVQSTGMDVAAIFAKAGKASLGGGLSGAAAAVVQVLSLMWLRTTMNFQYKNGGSTTEVLRTLWEQGGVGRFYRGISFALVQGPLSRFGDTAANVGVLALLESFESTRTLPLPVKSAAGSITAGLWRIALTPIDTYKTTLQVSGTKGLSMLGEKVAANGPGVLFEGALASAVATFVGHYPWYFTYNSLGEVLPLAPPGEPLLKLARQALLGLSSSCVSDCCSNSVRVLKTTKQTSSTPISYPEALRQVVDQDGVSGLFFRGLQTRILVNALQGALFAVVWKYFEELLKSGSFGS